jgi:type II secretory ATPase GspE/PulE/Tfp pilus assembly ATPase PilB-like protein
MNCDQAVTEIVAYLKNELGVQKRKQVAEHLAKCPACRQQLKEAARVLAWTESATDDAVVSRVDAIINSAIESNASDIHFEPNTDGSLSVRLRVDGVMRDLETFEAIQRHGVISRLKMLSELSVSETDLPQTGRLVWKREDRDYDLRVSTVPSIFGERVTIRILVDREFHTRGMALIHEHGDPHNATLLTETLGKPCGLLLIGGVPGSGKTTTYYCLISETNSRERTVFSIEDPVEQIVPGISQVELNRRAGLGFPEAMRAVMHQDPDVVGVGLLDDLTAAKLCIDAAMTGHLIMATMNATDVRDALKRMRDIGVSPYLMSSLVGVTCQRLVRRVCTACREEYSLSADDPMARGLGITPEELAGTKQARGTGCDQCRKTGYKGRTMLLEVLPVDLEIAKALAAGASEAEIVEMGRRKGFRSMIEDGKRKVLAGITTPEEVLRVLA